MRKFSTTFQAIDKTDGLIKTWIGQEIIAPSFKEAELICKNYFPYLSILGEKVIEYDEITLNVIDFSLN